MEPLTRVELLKGLAAGALFLALLAGGLWLVDIELNHEHRPIREAEIVLPLVPQVPWR